MGRKVMLDAAQTNFHRLAKEVSEQAVKDLRNTNPAFAKYQSKIELRTFRRKPKGFHRHQIDLVTNMLLNKAFACMTNAAIVDWLAEKFVGYRPSQSLMYVPLYPSSKHAIQVLLSENGFGVLKPDATLSTIKAIIRANGRSSKPVRSHNVDVSFSEMAVCLNGKLFPIDHSRKSPSIRVGEGRNYLRCDLLEALFTSGK